MIAITRPINGIGLNGDEFLLEENRDIKLFENKQVAYDFLRENVFPEATDEELEDAFNFVEESDIDFDEFNRKEDEV